MKNDSVPKFPHNDPIQVGQLELTAKQIVEAMDVLLSDSRKARICQVVRDRTFSVVTVLENLYDRGNASAVMRSAEAMGFQSVHIIEPGDKFKKANRVTKGADKWLDLTMWRSTAECIGALKKTGYKIYATHLDQNAVPIESVDCSGDIAFVLGNEKDGVSPEMLELCDQNIIIPMMGFVQSFNISVAAAIGLYHIHRERMRILGKTGDLAPNQMQILQAHFYLRSSKNPERLLKRLLKL